VRVGFDDRPGKELVGSLSCLRELTVWRFRGTDLGFLASPPPELETLLVDGMRQRPPISLEGVGVCRKLGDLEVGESRVTSLRPLSGLVSLKRLRVYPGYRAQGDTCLDLADLLPMEQLEQLHLIYVGAIQSLRPLLQMPSLRDLRLGIFEIRDGDLCPLDELPPRPFPAVSPSPCTKATAACISASVTAGK
jgi:hypothetical protein